MLPQRFPESFHSTGCKSTSPIYLSCYVPVVGDNGPEVVKRGHKLNFFPTDVQRGGSFASDAHEFGLRPADL